MCDLPRMQSEFPMLRPQRDAEVREMRGGDARKTAHDRDKASPTQSAEL